VGFAVSDTELKTWIDRGLVDPAAVKVRAVDVHDEPEGDPRSEKAFQADVEKFARKHGWKVYHTRDSRKSAFGFPDMVLLRGPVIIVAELKVGRNEPTAEQSEWLEAFRAADVQAVVWRPCNWPEISKALGV
jgi:hypothetical protein